MGLLIVREGRLKEDRRLMGKNVQVRAGTGRGARWIAVGLLLMGPLLGYVVGGEAGDLTTIDVSPSSVTMPVGGTQEFTVTGKDAQGDPVALSSPEVEGTGGTTTVRKDPATLATIVTYAAGDRTGDFYFEVWDSAISGRPGTAGALWGSADISVRRSAPSQLASMEISPPEVTLNVGDRQMFGFTGMDQLGNPYDHYDSVAWSATGGGSLDPSGSTCAYTATGPGDYSLTCTVTAGRATLIDSASLHVKRSESRLSAITVTPSIVTLDVGTQQQFSAGGTDQYGSPFPLSDEAAWTISGGGTIVAHGATCTYIATDYGQFRVTCAVHSGGSTFEGAATVSVVPPKLTTIGVSPSFATLDVGAQQTFTATGADQYGKPFPLQDPPVWTTSGGGTIEPSGSTCTYTATGYGQFRVTCTVHSDGGTFEGAATVSVVPPKLTTIGVSPSFATLDVGAQQTFTATGADQYGKPFPLQDPPVWTTSGGGTIVAHGPTCTYTAMHEEACSLTCTATAGGTKLEDSASIGVGRAELTTIDVTPAAVALEVGGQQQFTAVGKDQFGHPMMPLPRLQWTVTSTGGSITSAGRYTAGYRPGEGRIIAHFAGKGLSGLADIAILGVVCADPAVVVAVHSVIGDPLSNPEAYGSVTSPHSVHWRDAVGFRIQATGPAGSYDFRITLPSPVDPGSKLFRVSDWKTMPWTKAGRNTVQVTVKLAGGELTEVYVLASDPTGEGDGSTPMIP